MALNIIAVLPPLNNAYNILEKYSKYGNIIYVDPDQNINSSLVNQPSYQANIDALSQIALNLISYYNAKNVVKSEFLSTYKSASLYFSIFMIIWTIIVIIIVVFKIILPVFLRGKLKWCPPPDDDDNINFNQIMCDNDSNLYEQNTIIEDKPKPKSKPKKPTKPVWDLYKISKFGIELLIIFFLLLYSIIIGSIIFNHYQSWFSKKGRLTTFDKTLEQGHIGKLIDMFKVTNIDYVNKIITLSSFNKAVVWAFKHNNKNYNISFALEESTTTECGDAAVANDAEPVDAPAPVCENIPTEIDNNDPAYKYFYPFNGDIDKNIKLDVNILNKELKRQDVYTQLKRIDKSIDFLKDFLVLTKDELYLNSDKSSFATIQHINDKIVEILTTSNVYVNYIYTNTDLNDQLTTENACHLACMDNEKCVGSTFDTIAKKCYLNIEDSPFLNAEKDDASKSTILKTKHTIKITLSDNEIKTKNVDKIDNSTTLGQSLTLLKEWYKKTIVNAIIKIDVVDKYIFSQDDSKYISDQIKNKYKDTYTSIAGPMTDIFNDIPVLLTQIRSNNINVDNKTKFISYTRFYEKIQALNSYDFYNSFIFNCDEIRDTSTGILNLNNNYGVINDNLKYRNTLIDITLGFMYIIVFSINAYVITTEFFNRADGILVSVKRAKKEIKKDNQITPAKIYVRRLPYIIVVAALSIMLSTLADGYFSKNKVINKFNNQVLNNNGEHLAYKSELIMASIINDVKQNNYNTTNMKFADFKIPAYDQIYDTINKVTYIDKNTNIKLNTTNTNLQSVYDNCIDVINSYDKCNIIFTFKQKPAFPVLEITVYGTLLLLSFCVIGYMNSNVLIGDSVHKYKIVNMLLYKLENGIHVSKEDYHSLNLFNIDEDEKYIFNFFMDVMKMIGAVMFLVFGIIFANLALSASGDTMISLYSGKSYQESTCYPPDIYSNNN